MDEQEIRKRLKDLRKKAGFNSARSLSLAMGYEESYMAKIENGNNSIPSVSNLIIILNACKSSLEELFYENFEIYRLDKELRNLLKTITQKEKYHAITLLTVLKHEMEKVNIKQYKQKNCEQVYKPTNEIKLKKENIK